MTNVKHAPATALPWKELSVFGRGGCVIAGLPICKTNTKEDAAYITHAANAYPELIEALREARECLEGNQAYTVGFGLYLTRLLRELGELA